MDYITLTLNEPKLELIEFIKENLIQEFSKGFFLLNFSTYIGNYLYKSADKSLDINFDIWIEEGDGLEMIFETTLG